MCNNKKGIETGDHYLPDLGPRDKFKGWTELHQAANGRFNAGQDGVRLILSPPDKKSEFIVYKNHTLVYVHSAFGQPAIYPLPTARFIKPASAVLMDLDGTSVHSETFWIWIIERVTKQLTGKRNFRLEEEDEPFVSGHSVSEHLQYCINKYCPGASIDEARKLYYVITDHEMNEILKGQGRRDAFMPTPGLKKFLLELKNAKIKIGLVTSGLYQKAWPEIVSAFKVMNLGNPAEFYDAIITAGNRIVKGSPGTLGELCPKPHPWLYAEAAKVGLGLEREDTTHVIGIEDSAAGVLSIRLSGYQALGISGGNLMKSGISSLLLNIYPDLNSILEEII